MGKSTIKLKKGEKIEKVKKYISHDNIIKYVQKIIKDKEK